MDPYRRFLFRLALASGYWVANPDSLAKRMPYRILREWQDYAMLEPFGEERDDLRAAIIASTIANVFRGKRRRPFKPVDFMPQFNLAPPKPPTPDQLFAKVVFINRLLGGEFRDLRQPKD